MPGCSTSSTRDLLTNFLEFNLSQGMLNDLQQQVQTVSKLREEGESPSSAWKEKFEAAASDLNALKASFEDERAALLKRMEEAEGQLAPVTEELNMLKLHITKMIGVIFGKFL